MEDKDKNIKDAEVVSKDTPDTTKKEADKPETSTTDTSTNKAETSSAELKEADATGIGRMPLLAFIAGVATALVAWQLYSALSIDTNTGSSTYPDPVATVDGEPVDQALFEDNVANLMSGLDAQGVDTTDEAVREQYEAEALEVIINTRLLVNAAAEAGYEPTEEEVAERVAMLEQQFGNAEALDTELSSLGLTREDLQVDVIEQLSVDALLTNEVIPQDITVTNEEVQEVYDGLVNAGQEMPELATVRDAIVAQVQQQKQQDYIEAYLETLRAEADIEINI